MSTILRSRVVLVAVVVVVLVAGSAAGIYIHNRSSQTSQSNIPAAARPSAPPTVNVGAQTVKQTAAAEFLTVAGTNPAQNANTIALNAPIDITFNLPVDPEAVGKSVNISPDVPGAWAQGANNATARFTPSVNYEAGTAISVVIHSGLTSRDGFALASDYTFGFVTQVASDGVLFQSGYTVAKLLNAQSGKTLTITLQTGDQVPADVSIQTYKASINDLLSALVYDNSGQYSTAPIDVSHLTLLDSKGPIKNSDTFTIARPDGIYLLLATDANGQYGSMWLDITKYGILLRQDDQRIIVLGEDLATGGFGPSFGLTFYTLNGKVSGTAQTTFTGLAEFPARFPAVYDVAVAVNGDEVVVVPLNAPSSNADMKVTQDLSLHPSIYITTDRAAYAKGDTVKFAGVVRVSNDQQYTIPSNTSVEVWMEGQPPPVDVKVPVTANGTFSGSFAIPAGAFNSDGTDATQELYASITGAPQIYPLSNTTLVALGPHTPSGKLSVTFDKTEYVLKDTVTATIAGAGNNGAALANQTVSLTIFSAGVPTAPKEIDSFASPSSWGTPNGDPIAVKLDATGKATYQFKANIAGIAADQQVTAEVTYGSGAAQAVAARTVTIYQGADEVYMLPSRNAYVVGEQVVAPFVVETRAGDRVPNATMSYEFDDTTYNGSTSTTTVVLGGTVATDANGVGLVKAVYKGPNDGIQLVVKGNDAGGNTFQDTMWLSMVADQSNLAYQGLDRLVQLGVLTDKIAYKVGDTANLTVTSPADENVLMSLERGRIHSYKWIALKAGDNALQVNVTPDLAPGFSVVFSYFRNGVYESEGLAIPINNSDRLLNVAVKADKTSYAAGQSAQLTVTVTDSSGKPVAATLFADGYDAIMSSYKLVDQASIGGVFLTPGLRATNGSSSLVGIGANGGRCGGGAGGDLLAVTLAGKSDLWSAGISTDATSGTATVTVPIAASTVRMVIIASTSTTSVGQAELDLTVG